MSFSHKNQADFIEIVNSISPDLDDLLNIDNDHFDQMVHKIHPEEHWLNKAVSDIEASFLGLDTVDSRYLELQGTL